MSFWEPAYTIRIGSQRTSETMSRVRLANWLSCQKLEQMRVEEVLIAARWTWFAAGVVVAHGTVPAKCRGGAGGRISLVENNGDEDGS